MEVKQRDHGTLRGEVSTVTLHMEQKQEKERLARERAENLEVSRGVLCVCQWCVIVLLVQGGVSSAQRLPIGLDGVRE